MELAAPAWVEAGRVRAKAGVAAAVEEMRVAMVGAAEAMEEARRARVAAEAEVQLVEQLEAAPAAQAWVGAWEASVGVAMVRAEGTSAQDPPPPVQSSSSCPTAKARSIAHPAAS